MTVSPHALSFLSSACPAQRAQCSHLTFCREHKASKDDFGRTTEHLDTEFTGPRVRIRMMPSVTSEKRPDPLTTVWMLVVPISVHLTMKKMCTHLHPTPLQIGGMPFNAVLTGLTAYSMRPVGTSASAWDSEITCGSSLFHEVLAPCAVAE